MIKCCNELTNNSSIVVRENRREFRIDNRLKIQINRVEVDGCLITEGQKCDYLFEIIEQNRVFYVELKGSHINEAVRQLEATIEFCQNKHRNSQKGSFIVASKVPKSRTKIQNLKKEFKKRNGHILKISTTKHIETIQ